MALHFLDLSSLEDLDPRLCEHIRQSLRKCALDCEDRATNPEPRKVSLTFEVRPVVSDMQCVGAELSYAVAVRLPDQKSPRSYALGMRHDKQGRLSLVFNDQSADNLSQLGFEDVDHETGKASQEIEE